MKHLGDICKINGAEIAPVDIITGGSPCQDLSVAGKREGLAGERSGLFMEQIRVCKEMREHDRANGRTSADARPRYMVWENVPGALSSNDGKDFQAVLSEIARVADKELPDIPMPQTGKWSYAGGFYGVGSDGCPFSVAWRIHDAQFWGVPQRRRRVCVLADWGGYSAGEILFDAQCGRETACDDSNKAIGNIGGATRSEIQPVGESLPRDSKSCGETGQGIADRTESGADGTSYTLKIRGGVERDSGGRKAGKGALVQTEKSATLGVSQDQTLIQVYGISPYESNSMKSSNPNSGVYEADTARTLDNNGGSPACNQGGIAVVTPIEGNGTRESHRGNGYGEAGEPCFTLNSTEHHAVAVDVYNQTIDGEVAATVTSAVGGRTQAARK